MRLVYVDEAGIGHSGEEPFLTVGAVIVDGDRQLTAVERHLEKIVKRHIPEEHWEDFVFHATHLFNWGGKIFTKNNPEWPLPRRLEIADELAAIPKRFNLPVTVGICERARFPSDPSLNTNYTKQQMTILAHVVTFGASATKVDQWMRQNASNEICMMIVEDNDQARRHIRDAQNYYRGRSALPDLIERAPKLYPLRKIKEDPAFQPKRPGSVLQLADFWTYVAKRLAMSPGDDRWLRFSDPMRDQIWEPFQGGLPA